jgi:type II restriction enzyme
VVQKIGFEFFMNLFFKTKLADKYSNASQKIRVLTEHWVDESVFCPNCGHVDIDKYENNKPVADFHCTNCGEDYELKSKKNQIGTKVVDGAYHTMLERLTSTNNPNFFLLRYNLSNFEVTNFFVIPKHFFVPKIIEKRNPLASTARRAGWIGCNILLNSIPQTGKIYYVRDKQIEPKAKVLKEWKKTLFLREEKEVVEKGWLTDIMRCIEKLSKREFILDDVYAFEKKLSQLHPENSHIKDKIRQQLQILRDKGYLDFISRGYYRVT